MSKNNNNNNNNDNKKPTLESIELQKEFQIINKNINFSLRDDFDTPAVLSLLSGYYYYYYYYYFCY